MRAIIIYVSIGLASGVVAFLISGLVQHLTGSQVDWIRAGALAIILAIVVPLVMWISVTWFARRSDRG